MGTKKKVQLNVYILASYRDMLGKMAAERMMKDPSRSATASHIGAEIICESLDHHERQKEINEKLTHKMDMEDF